MKEGSGKVRLIAKGVDDTRIFDSSTNPKHRNVEAARFKICQTFRIMITMICYENDQQVLPLRKLADLIHKLPDAAVGEGHGIQIGMFQVMKRNFKRFVTAERKECAHPIPAVLSVFDHLVEMIERVVIVSAPFVQ